MNDPWVHRLSDYIDGELLGYQRREPGSASSHHLQENDYEKSRSGLAVAHARSWPY